MFHIVQERIVERKSKAYYLNNSKIVVNEVNPLDNVIEVVNAIETITVSGKGTIDVVELVVFEAIEANPVPVDGNQVVKVHEINYYPIQDMGIRIPVVDDNVFFITYVLQDEVQENGI